MKKIKLLCAFISVFVLCLVLTKGVEAVTIYTASATSETHTVSSFKQYFKVNAECRDLINDRIIDSWTSAWYHSGSGASSYSHTTVTIEKTGNYYKKYAGTSLINKTSKKLIATLNY